MSRTDVHVPYRVKRLQPEWRVFFVEYHDHTIHPCNFSAENEVSTDCHLGAANRGKNIYCGCSMCTGQVWRKQSRRADRYRAKRLLRSERWDDVQARLRCRY